MTETRDTAEIRDALDKLTAELKLTRITFTAMRTTIEDILLSGSCEDSPGYTNVRRDMN
jgi:hypothetical protein